MRHHTWDTRSSHDYSPAEDGRCESCIERAFAWLTNRKGKRCFPLHKDNLFRWDDDANKSVNIQGNGVAIVLNKNGTWRLEDTTGG
jgi:hypothetical protein